MKPLKYGPFVIVEHVSENAFKLDLPAYMQIYSVINVKNLKLFKPTMITEEDANKQVLPSIEDLSTGTMVELGEDSVL